MKLKEFKEKLKSFSKEKIIITKHAEMRALIREINLDEVKENLINPEKLVFFEEQIAEANSKKYNCYFEYSKELAHRYIFTMNGNILIVTIIKINRNWQATIKRK